MVNKDEYILVAVNCAYKQHTQSAILLRPQARFYNKRNSYAN